MVVFDLNMLISEFNYSELYEMDYNLDIELNSKHRLRVLAKNNSDVLNFDKCNDIIDVILSNKENVKRALMFREKESVELFKNRLMGIHYLN
jgi:hypothetical protein